MSFILPPYGAFHSWRIFMQTGTNVFPGHKCVGLANASTRSEVTDAIALQDIKSTDLDNAEVWLRMTYDLSLDVSQRHRVHLHTLDTRTHDIGLHSVRVAPLLTFLLRRREFSFQALFLVKRQKCPQSMILVPLTRLFSTRVARYQRMRWKSMSRGGGLFQHVGGFQLRNPAWLSRRIRGEKNERSNDKVSDGHGSTNNSNHHYCLLRVCDLENPGSDRNLSNVITYRKWLVPAKINPDEKYAVRTINFVNRDIKYYHAYSWEILEGGENFLWVFKTLDLDISYSNRRNLFQIPIVPPNPQPWASDA